MDPTDPHWRVNSSFSPFVPSRWVERHPSRGTSHRAYDTDLPLSAFGKDRGSVPGSDQSHNHQPSVSDGAFSHSASPPDNILTRHRMPSVCRIDHGEFSTPTIVPRASADGPYPRSSNERNHATMDNSGSASPFSDAGQWAPSSKPSPFLRSRNHFGKRPFIPKPVYPLVFHNPISEGEASGQAMPSDDGRTRLNSASPILRFEKLFTETSQKMPPSPDLHWSNVSSRGFGYDGDHLDVQEHITSDSRAGSVYPIRHLRCSLCERSLSRKSPWSSDRLVRNPDMPITGVLSCCHVFHADCLEKATPTDRASDPPCPLCLGTVVREDIPSSSSEQSHVLPRTSASRHGQHEVDWRRNRSFQALRHGGSFIHNRFKRHSPFAGRTGSDFVRRRVFRQHGSSSSAPRDDRLPSIYLPPRSDYSSKRMQ